MVGPLAGISAAQIAQQKLQDQPAQALKQGPSKFDGAMQAKQAQAPQGAEAVAHAHKADAAQKAQQATQANKVADVNKADKASMNKINPAAQDTKPVTDKGLDPVKQRSEVSQTTHSMASTLADIEKGGSMIDKLLKGGFGKNMSNQDMLSLQAGMYKYTQELELTGKVIEKATSGLKDTLKTQV